MWFLRLATFFPIIRLIFAYFDQMIVFGGLVSRRRKVYKYNSIIIKSNNRRESACGTRERERKRSVLKADYGGDDGCARWFGRVG